MPLRDLAWERAETDPKVIRVYDHPVDGRYLLGVDVVAWLRDLAQASEAGDALNALITTPLLDRMADVTQRWLDQAGTPLTEDAPDA